MKLDRWHLPVTLTDVHLFYFKGENPFNYMNMGIISKKKNPIQQKDQS